MKSFLVAAAVAAAALAIGAWDRAAYGQAPPNAVEPGLVQLAIKQLPAKSQLTITTSAFKAGADIPFANTQYQGNVFPGLTWTKGPAATKSYAVIMQDADAMVRGAPLLHWSMINVPATTLTLKSAMAEPPTGAANGPNIKGASQPYMGPRTPAGPKHRYHFQVFALDTNIDGAPADYAALTAAMKDHVLASGQIIGLGQIDPTAPPPPGATTNTATVAPIPAAPPPGPAAQTEPPKQN